MEESRQRHNQDVVSPHAENSEKSHVGKNLSCRQAMYDVSIKDPAAFWCRMAEDHFFWKTLWESDSTAMQYNFYRSKGKIDIKWFEGAKTNMCCNALDRHLPHHKNRVCYHWEGNAVSESSTVTYGQMYEEVLKLSALLKHRYGIQKGDRVAVYLPVLPFTAQVMLAAARIGAVVSVIFAGYSAQALAARILDSGSKLIITADATTRGTKPILLKSIVDEAIAECERIGYSMQCLVYERQQRDNIAMREGRDAWYADEVAKLSAEQVETCPIEWVDAEDPLFMLYTSGSTGKPKAILHTTGGYMVFAGITFKYSFDYHDEDMYFCTADIGWITGHTYVVYGPMLNAATSVLYEGVPTHPTASRWWELVDKHRVTIFYTAPTAIRALMKFGDDCVRQTSRETLRILGTVGEPINVEAWRWYHDTVGECHADVIDTWWQTESGGHLITPLPGCTPMKPGSASLPFFGVSPVLLDAQTHKELEGPGEGLLAIKGSWPAQARSIYGDHARFEQVYFSIDGYYLSGDGARRDEDGYYWITGRVDDVLNVSSHRIGTSEIEDAVNTHHAVVESAVVPVPHDVKGDGIYVYVTFHDDVEINQALLNDIKNTVRAVIGAFATPDHIQPAQCGLPKTRSGKIVRRILRKIASGISDEFGDTTTLLDLSVVDKLISERKKWILGSI